MNVKKFLAGLLTVALVMAPMTAMASSGGIEIEGDATYVETTKYVVTVPTSAKLQFNLDPTGVYGYFLDNDGDAGDSVTSGDLVDYAGKIVGQGYDKIINKSSVDVVVTCDYTLTSSAQKLNVVTGGDAVTVSGNEVCLKIIGGTLSGSDFIEGTYALPVGTASTKASVALDAVDYMFQLSGGDLSTGDIIYVPVDDDAENMAVLSIGGVLSKDGDWSELDTDSSLLKLTCVYSFKGAKDISAVATTDKFVTNSSDLDDLEYLEASGSGSGSAVKSYSVSSGSTSVVIDAAKGKTLRATDPVILYKTDSTTVSLKTGTHFNFTSSTGNFAIIRDTVISTNTGAKMTLYFTDGTTVDVAIQ